MHTTYVPTLLIFPSFFHLSMGEIALTRSIARESVSKKKVRKKKLDGTFFRFLYITKKKASFKPFSCPSLCNPDVFKFKYFRRHRCCQRNLEVVKKKFLLLLWVWERGTVAILLSPPLPSSEKLISLPLFLGANAWRAGDKTRLPRVKLMQFIIYKNTFLISHIGIH